MRRAFLVLLLGLAACGANPPLPARPAPEQITIYAFAGRLAVRQGEARHHVRIEWRHEPGKDTILLSTPFGQGLAELTRDAAGARLALADRREFLAPDWDTLTEQVFGFRLPLSSAAHWLLGDITDTQGWRLEIIERENDNQSALPGVIEFEREDISVRLKIDEWSEVR